MNGELAIAILAAGQARRFGGAKLDVSIGGRPLGRFALDTALALGAARPVIIVANSPPSFALRAAEEGVAELIANPRAHEGLGSSVALAATYAATAGCKALLLLLADMPSVHEDTLRRLIGSVAPHRPAAVRHADGNPGIPACFPSDFYPLLQKLEGDRGAGALLRAAEQVCLIEITAEELRDVDRPEDLATLRPLAKSKTDIP